MQDKKCFECVYYLGKLKCAAFNNIPDTILLGDNNHSTPLEGQGNNIVFEPIEEQQSTNFNN